MEISVYNIKGKETGKKISLSEEVFGITPNQHVIWLDVKHYLANQRQGTHKAKERGEIRGSTRKLKKQKGTGGARAGSANSPTRVGGGRIFGPRVRDYDFKLNKKVKNLARASAYSDKVADGKLSVIENFTFEAPKTKSYLEFLAAFETNTKSLLILPAGDKNVYLSSRNVPKNRVITADTVNTYDIVNADRLFLLEGAVEKIQAILS